MGKQPSKAECAFERSLALRTDSAIEETNVASAYREAGDMDGTMEHLERAVAIDPLQLPAASLLIKLYRQQGNEAKASELSERVLALMEERPDPTQSAPGSASSSPKLA